MSSKIKLNVVAGALAMMAAGSANAGLVLPNVEMCGAAIQTLLSGGLNNLQCLQGSVTGSSPGTYVASYHDEFLSYSIEALETIQKKNESMLPIATYGDWSKLVAGSGQLDVGVLIKANGGGVLNNFDPFPDAVSSNTSDTIYVRTWAGSGGTDTNDPGSDPNDPVLTVQEVVDWLSPMKIPAFYFDLADPQNDPTAPMWFSGRVYVTDATGATLKDEWAFDNIFDGNFDIDSMVLAPKNVPVYIPGSGCSSVAGVDWCMITNSRGSGSPEFIAYAPEMDLQQWAKDGNLFWGNFKISSTSAADEEIYLTKRVGTTTVPEPGALALMGLGLLGMAFARRRMTVSLI